MTRQAVPQQEQIRGSDPKHHAGMTVQPIPEPTPARERKVFADRQSVDVTHAATVEVAAGGVMNRVGPAPEVVGRHGDDAEDPADPVIDGLMPEEGAVTAVVLDHEQAHEKAGSRYGDQQ